MLEIFLTTVIVASATTLPTAPEAADDEIAGWAAAAKSGSSEAERGEALDRLRRVSGGAPNDERTREAVFALQEVLSAAGALHERELRDVTKAAVALYPDDPRTEELLRLLGLSLLDDGDRYGAHYMLSRLLADSTDGEEAALLVRASANAAAVGDGASAFRWSSGVDAAGLTLEQRELLWRTQLKVAFSLGRHTEALEALARLDERSPEAVRRDAAALLAAARSEAAVGRLVSASDRYEAFLNIHARHPERPAAILAQAKLQVHLNRIPAALRLFDWIVEEHPDSPESDLARVERIEIGPSSLPVARAEAYRKAAEESRTAGAANEACRRLVEQLIAEGMPLEAISMLGWMARQPSGFAALAARRSLIEAAEPAVALIASREDVVGLAAVAAEIEAAGLEIPARFAAVVRKARHELGLSTPGEDPAEATRQVAEQLWRDGHEDEALEKIGHALSLDALTPVGRRSLLVLRADIRFAAGDSDESCTDYRAAGSLGSSRWVDHQLTPCEAGAGDAAEGES